MLKLHKRTLMKFFCRFRSIHNTAGARKTVTAVTATFSNAKSTFSTWFSNLSVKEELSKDIIDMEERDKVESVDN